MIVTFYSFKGGVGRSMAMVNVGEILASRGYRVVLCDWDLEAPGLERYLVGSNKGDETYQQEVGGVLARDGLMDMLREYKETLAKPMTDSRQQADHERNQGASDVQPRYQKLGELLLRRPFSYTYSIPTTEPNRGPGWMRLLTAGRRDGEENQQRYAEAVRRFDWDEFYEKWAGAAYMEFFRVDLDNSSDIVLIDSRTGVTEQGGVCTHHLADLVVLLSAANEMNVEGTRWMVRVLTDRRLEGLRMKRPLKVLPVASRIEWSAQKEELRDFENRFRREFRDYIPDAIGDPESFLQKSEVPYIPFYSFKERVVAREPQERRDPRLFDAYATLADAIVRYGVSSGKVAQLKSRSSVIITNAPENAFGPEPPKGAVFISYSVGSDETAKVIAAGLRALGLQIVLDPETTGTQPGWRLVKDAVGCVVVIGTQGIDAVQRAELDYVLRRQVLQPSLRIVPLLLPTAAVSSQANSSLAQFRALSVPEQLVPSRAEFFKAVLAELTAAPTGPILIPASDVCFGSFGETDARFFFGRDGDVDRILMAAAQKSPPCRWIQIEGPSGCGKSALARAALLPAARAGRLNGVSRGCVVAICHVAADPLADLANALKLSGSLSPKFSLALPSSGASLREAIREITNQGKTLLLLVDSLDTLLSSDNAGSAESASVQQFDALLAGALIDRELPFFLLTTVRSHLLSRFFRLPHLQAVLEQQALRHSPSPMTDGELEEIISAPASAAGLVWQSGLSERVLEDGRGVRTTPGLLSALLKALWAVRTDNQLTHQGYQMIGGLAGVLREYANRALKTLSENDAPAAKSLLLRLVSSNGTRLVAGIDDAIDAAGKGAKAEKLLTALATAGVITIDADSVQISHDGLRSQGSFIGNWLESGRESIERRDSLEDAAAAWEAAGKPKGGLPSGGQLNYFQKVDMYSKKADQFLAEAHKYEKLIRRRKALLWGLCTILLITGLAGAIWKWYPRPPGVGSVQKASFTPVCTLPFKGARNPAIDDHCGISGGSPDEAKLAEATAKNNFCAATASPDPITYQQLIDLQMQSRNISQSVTDRKEIENMGEGNYVSYIAVIKEAHYSDTTGGENVNCNMSENTPNDIHIVLMSDPNDSDECHSTTAEISPHYRPTNWTPEKLNSLGKPVRIKGQLFYDNSHVPCSGRARPNPKRMSLWEIHPVYSIEVCQLSGIEACQNSKNPGDWMVLE